MRKRVFQGLLAGLGFFGLGLWMINCAIVDPKVVQQCGAGFTQTSDGCKLTASLCTPPCPSDETCREGKCVARYPDSQSIACATPCEPGTFCDERVGRCVSIEGCPNACPQGYTCFRGSCVLRTECNPPCPQIGYVCQNGLCERICAPECASGQVCVNGVCQKACVPDCKANEFCQNGACQTLRDADNDGFTNDRDCDDNDNKTNPRAVEVCNNKDNNCDGLVDNIDPVPCYEGAANTLGRGTCRAGLTACRNGAQICEGQRVPVQEVCGDGLDNDCDGVIDNGCP